jgi:acetylornithine deacetylase
VDSRVVEIARRLIAFNTTVPMPGAQPIEELECQRYITSLLEAAGFEIDVWEPSLRDISDHPAYRDQQNFNRRPIVVATLRGTGGGRSLILNGHIDTVPAGTLAEWSCDPWTPTVRDGLLYGRGAADMKGGVAAMLDAALTIADGPRPAGDLLVQVVTDEEMNGLGTIAAIRRGYRADAAVVPEPTGLDICVAFRGILVGELEIEGRQGHVEIRQPHWEKGGAVNAIDHMVRALTWLRALDEEWRERPDKQHPLCSSGEIHVSTISGGDFQANVPEHCLATVNVCYVPGEQDADGRGGEVKEELERHLARLQYGWLARCPPRLRWLTDFPPVELPADAPLVTELAATLQGEANHRPLIMGVDTWDDTASLVVEANVPAVSCGPGSNDQAHAVDEYVSIDELSRAAAGFTAFARRWCSGDGGAGS